MDDALGDLNRSTNRLRRQFDPTDKWMETRPQIFDARHVGGHEFSQIDLERNLSCACAEQFRNLRDTQTAGEPEDASIGLLNDADCSGNYTSTRRYLRISRPAVTQVTTR